MMSFPQCSRRAADRGFAEIQAARRYGELDELLAA